MVSSNGILVKRLQTSYEIIKVLQQLTSFISLQNVKESLAQCVVGIIGDNRLVRNLAKL